MPRECEKSGNKPMVPNSVVPMAKPPMAKANKASPAWPPGRETADDTTSPNILYG
jgi:hypothetical protein